MFNSRSPVVFFSPEGDLGAGSTNPPVVPPVVKQADIDDAVDKRIRDLLGSKKADNDPMAALTIAVRQSQTLETRAQTAERERDEARRNVIDDATKARLATLDTYEKFGKPAEIEARFKALETKAEKADRFEVEGVAGRHGYKPLLADFAKKNGFAIEEREITDRDGKKVMSPVAITKEGDKPVEKPLREFLEAHHKDYLPALQVTETRATGPGAAPAPTPGTASAQQQASAPRRLGIF